MNVLFICTGNTCRSVLAQFLFNREAGARGLADWKARSGGLAAERYFVVPPGVRKALAARGVDRIEHVPQLVTRDLLRWADLALPMTHMHRNALHDEFPEHRHKTKLFLEAAGRGELDVEDPIGQPDEVYFRCADLIEKAVHALIEKHAPSTAGPRP